MIHPMTIVEALQRVDPALKPGAKALRIALLREGRSAGWLAREMFRNVSTVGAWTRGEAAPRPAARTTIHKLLGVDPTEWDLP